MKVITASADGYVKVFDTKSQDNINTFSPPSAHLVAINDIKIAPDTDRSNPLLYVCTESNQVVKMNLTGQVLKTYSSQKADVGSEFRCITVSRKGKYLFAISKNGSLYTFDTQDGKLIHILPEIATKEIIGIASHPTRQGYLAAWSFDNTVALLKP